MATFHGRGANSTSLSHYLQTGTEGPLGTSRGRNDWANTTTSPRILIASQTDKWPFPYEVKMK